MRHKVRNLFGPTLDSIPLSSVQITLPHPTPNPRHPSLTHEIRTNSCKLAIYCLGQASAGQNAIKSDKETENS